MIFPEVFGGPLSEAIAIDIIRSLVPCHSAGSWVLFGLQYFGADTEDEYLSMLVKGKGSEECILTSSSTLERALAGGKVGLDWSELYFIPGDPSETRKRIEEGLEIRCATVILDLDGVRWSFSSVIDEVADHLRAEPRLMPGAFPPESKPRFQMIPIPAVVPRPNVL